MDFDSILNDAIKKCNGYNDFYIYGNNFFEIYPFTTENITGYINNFELNNKSLLTVGSSGDQILNAIYNGCKDISLVDINEYTKYYYYLKVASILSLNLNEFLNFLSINGNYFNQESLEKTKSVLRTLDCESYLFWNELFKKYDKRTIRERLFSNDEDKNVSKYNLYLKDDKSYSNIKAKVTNVTPNFINSDIYEYNPNKNYDNIWLSNICTYVSIDKVVELITKMDKLLKLEGNMLVSYLYLTDVDTEYNSSWAPIYNLKRVFNIFKYYNFELKTFDGVRPHISEDSILIYKKIK